MASNPVHDKLGNVQEQMASAMERVGEAAHNVGQKVSDFFQGNPFETPVGRKIELATDASRLATENWGLNMEICDFVNSTNEGPRDAIRAIKKRLQTQMGKNNAIVMYTLTVLETCVKNCDLRFTVLVCQKEFVAELVKLVSAKFDPPQIVQERVLALIQSWADAFRGNPALSGVLEMYEELRAKGVEFPATDLDTMAPILTPKQTVFPEKPPPTAAKTTTTPISPYGPKQTFPASDVVPTRPATHQRQQHHQTHQGGGGPLQLGPDQMAKLRSELDIVQVNMQVLRELVAKMKPGNGGNGQQREGQQQQGQREQPEPPEDFHFVQELHSTCKEMQTRILDLIPGVTNEEVTYELLSMNDELNATFEKFDRCMANFNQQGIDLTMIPGASGTSAAVPSQQREEEDNSAAVDLIDLGPNAGKPLSEQFQAIDIHGGGGNVNTVKEMVAKGSDEQSNAGYVHDQASVGIHTVAYNKPEPSSHHQPAEEAEEASKEVKGSQKPQKAPAIDDDGL